ncbi:hypothetical protein AgCh_037042 [Apium graveolens]
MMFASEDNGAFEPMFISEIEVLGFQEEAELLNPYLYLKLRFRVNSQVEDDTGATVLFNAVMERLLDVLVKS